MKKHKIYPCLFRVVLKGQNHQAPFSHNDSRDESDNHYQSVELTKRTWNQEINRLQDLQIDFSDRIAELRKQRGEF
jgi:hypothetical protein